MSEVPKVWNAWNTVLLITDQRACRRCRRCETLYCIINKGSKAIYVVFVAFNNTVYRLMLLILLMLEVLMVYSVYSGLSPLPGEKAIWAFCLGIYLFTTSQFKEAVLLTFLDLSTTRVIVGKMHSQSPILKTNGVLSNLVILTYLWEQSCMLHTLNKLPA